MFISKVHLKNYVNKAGQQTQFLLPDTLLRGIMLFFVTSLQKGFQLLQWNLSQVVEEGWRERLWTASVSLLRPVFCVPITVQAWLNRSLGQESWDREICITGCYADLENHIYRVCVWFSATFMILGHPYFVQAFIMRITVHFWFAPSPIKVQSPFKLRSTSSHLIMASHYFQIQCLY